MTGIELVRRILDDPQLSDEEAEDILWSCTGWPSFFHTDRPFKELSDQLRHARRAMERGFNADEIYMGEDRLR